MNPSSATRHAASCQTASPQTASPQTASAPAARPPEPPGTLSEARRSVPESGRTLLAIDTSLGSVAAVSRGGTAWQVSSDDRLGHTETIAALITRALRLAGVTAADIDGVVMGVGPGPFTGLRVGMAAARAFAAGACVPLLPVISHEASAREALRAGAADGADCGSAADRVRIVQDARRREFFVSDWAGGARAELIAGPRVTPQAGYRPAAAVREVRPTRVSAIDLIGAALDRLATGAGFAAPDPLYLRDPDVRLPAKPVTP